MSENPIRPTAVTPETADTPSPRVGAPHGPLESGQLLASRYRLGSPIATGGMATVWQATDEVLTRPVAVKVLHARLAADPQFVARFRREAVAAARLSHPSIVAIYDTCDDPEAIVMELVEGRTLRAELDDRHFVPPAEAVEIASGIAQALDVAHRAGLVHRDVKPANVLLSSDGRLKVADFGIAKAARESDDPDLPDLTSVGHMVGTAKYLAPEQVSGGAIDARTDVYALGAVLYEMLCGRPPFVGDNDLATATARLHGQPARPRSVLRTVPEQLDRIVMKALSTDPADRYESAAAFWADLQAVSAHEDAGQTSGPVSRPADATAIGTAPSFARAERSWLVPTLLVSMVAVALGLAWILIGGTEAGRDLFDLVERVAPGRTAATDAEPVEGLTATTFDPPPGDGGENDSDTDLAVDGDPDTAWTTERYDSRDLGGLKPGVGLVVDLGGSHDVAEITVESSSPEWAAFFFVVDEPGTTIEDWGEPVGAVAEADAGSTTVELDGASGAHLLMWLTDLGTDGGFRFVLEELTVSAT